MRHIIVLFALSAPIACADVSSQEEEPLSTVGATHDHQPVGVCQRDPVLLESIRGANYACPCEVTVGSEIVRDDACVVSACSDEPDLVDAVCRPDQGYQCAGTLQLPSAECTGAVTQEVDPTCCAARFRHDGDGGCLLTVPLTCRMNGDRPDGTYCSMERGGICWFDCVPTAPSIAGAEVCESCDCNGRCDAPDYRDTPPSRPRIAVDPESVSFDFDPELPLAPYRFMLSANLPNVPSVDIVVRAPRGFAVACPASTSCARVVAASSLTLPAWATLRSTRSSYDSRATCVTSPPPYPWLRLRPMPFRSSRKSCSMFGQRAR